MSDCQRRVALAVHCFATDRRLRIDSDWECFPCLRPTNGSFLFVGPMVPSCLHVPNGTCLQGPTLLALFLQEDLFKLCPATLGPGFLCFIGEIIAAIGRFQSLKLVHQQ